MTKDQFISYLKHPELLDNESISALKEIIEDYPCFPVARMLYLKNLRNISSYRFEAELSKHALFIPDRKMLFRLLNMQVAVDNEFELLPFDKEEFNEFATEKNVKMANIVMHSPSVYELNDNENSNEKPTNKEYTDLIDKFISENPSISQVRSTKAKQVEISPATDTGIDDGLITETLAGIYVKQGLYNDALNAYEKLSLKFPEKNTYFASQIEKIKKLISKDL